MELIHIEGLDAQVKHQDLTLFKKTGLAVFAIGILFILITLTGIGTTKPVLFFILSTGLTTLGALIYISALANESPPGIKNDLIMFSSMMSRGALGWILATILTGFYIVLYWFPDMFENWIRLLDPLSYLITKNPADQWFLYGTWYTLAILVMGIRMILYKYRHNRYHQIRTLSIMFFQ